MSGLIDAALDRRWRMAALVPREHRPLAWPRPMSTAQIQSAHDEGRLAGDVEDAKCGRAP
jgi:hypothetical protein